MQRGSDRTFVIWPAKAPSDLQGDAWDRVLSVKTLQSVRDLNLDCYQYHRGEPEWPTTWSELTNLTRSLQVGHKVSRPVLLPRIHDRVEEPERR